MSTDYNSFVSSLSNLEKITPRQDAEMLERINGTLIELKELGEVNKETLSDFFQKFPNSVPLIATTGGLGQEQLKNQLKLKFDTPSWNILAKKRPYELVEYLDSEFQIIDQLNREMDKDWSYGDILVERHLWSKKSGASSVGRGRKIEDEVEKIAITLGLPYAMRTRFEGRGKDTAPCDLAIPGGMDKAVIAIGMKGFNSTGSKLTDAVVEIEKMASVRLPQQYIYAVIDGIGWLSRQSDLRRIHALWENKMIDGLYTLQHMDKLAADIKTAAIRIGLLN